MAVELEEAVALLLAHTPENTGIERLALERAAGRICAEQLRAPIDQPPFDRSPLDGYALRAADTDSAARETPVCLRVVGRECAGESFTGQVRPGEAVMIMTGARIPDGCDCVIRQEQTQGGDGWVRVFRRLRARENCCFAGEDIRRGELLARPGDRLSFVHLGVLASVGFAALPVLRPARVALLHSGDEIVGAGEPLRPGQVYNSSRPMLTARLRQFGVEVIGLPDCPDDPRRMAAEIDRLLPEVDAVITTGGVSVGQKDIMHETLALLGARRLFRRLHIKPGSPMLGAQAQGKPLLCLSGNPFAALATFELLARPVLARLTGDRSIVCRTGEAVMGCDFNKTSDTRRFIRAHCTGGVVDTDRADRHSSGSLVSMLGCNVLVDIPAGTPGLRRGERVRVVEL